MTRLPSGGLHLLKFPLLPNKKLDTNVLTLALWGSLQTVALGYEFIAFLLLWQNTTTKRQPKEKEFELPCPEGESIMTGKAWQQAAGAGSQEMDHISRLSQETEKVNCKWVRLQIL